MTELARSSNIKKLQYKKTGLMSRLWEQRYLQAMGLPGVIWMVIFCYVPMYGITIAFKDYNISKSMMSAPFIGFDHFVEFFKDENFFSIMQNTFAISFIKLAIGFPIPIIFAILLNELISTKFKRAIQTITYLPHFLSWAVLGGIMVNWFSDSGAYNGIMMSLGIIQQPISILGEANYFWIVAVLSEVWKEMGWNSVIYLAAISGIDMQLYESAELDGAGRLRKMWNITLPSIKGTIAILFILNVGNLLNTNFDQIFVLTNQLNLDKSNVIDLYVYRMGMQSGRFSYATAIGVFRSVIALILLVLASKTSKALTGQSLYGSDR